MEEQMIVQPCPEHGHEPVELETVYGSVDTRHRVKCTTCGMSTKWRLFKDQALDEWNEAIIAMNDFDRYADTTYDFFDEKGIRSGL
jgi:endogenous inhibitor of DNA gyrase (YacG/DUF329 family)